MAFGFNSTTDDVLAGVDLTGKTILVTGASGGLGEETARALAARGASVTIAARSQDKLDAAAARIGKGTGNTVETGLLALDRPESVRTFAEAWMAGHDQLNILINNAGVMACPLSRTKEGWEMQFATNHLGHFLLTNLLLPALKKGAPGRVVNLSSAAHLYATVDLEDPNFVSRDYNPQVAYGQSKTANIWFTRELDKRLAGDGIRAFAVQPGGIHTDLGRHMSQEQLNATLQYMEDQGVALKTIPQGAATTCWGATSSDLKGKGGGYLEDCGVAGPSPGPEEPLGYAPHAVDARGAANLWVLSNKLLGTEF